MQYNKPPLPFMGNKRNMLKNIKKVLNLMQEDGQIDRETIFIDCFGGSGLISHNIKQSFPSCRVIWNDYDNYQERLAHIADTERLRAELYRALSHIKSHDKLTQTQKQATLEIIQAHKDSGAYIDYTTISTYLLFSGHYAKDFESLAAASFFNRLSYTPLGAQDYLAGVERVQADFTELLEAYKHIQNKCLVLDPPYLQTQVGNYADSFNLGQFFTLMEKVSKPYVFFGSHKSDILPAFEYLSRHITPLQNYTYNTANLNINTDTDYIIYPKPRSLFA